MGGQLLDFSEADLQATVAAYTPTKPEAPLVVGHPSHDAPAYGWVAGLQFCDGAIDATPAQVNTDFADMVAAGAYKKISASFYSPTAPQNPVPGVYYLRHVGFLGAQPPAVKGLRTPSFADTEDGVLTFEFSEPQPPETTVTLEEKAAIEAENARLRTELANLKTTAIHGANVAFCEKQAGVLPAWRDVAVATLDHFALQPAVVEFGEGESKAPLAEKFKAMLAALPSPVQFGEAATNARAAESASQTNQATTPEDVLFAESADPERLAKHKAIQAHMQSHKTDYLTAARAVWL